MGGSPSNPLPFFVSKYFRASLTRNKYQVVSTNKCKHYTITSPQEETEKINTHLAEVASPVVNKNDKSFYGVQILLRNIRRGPCKLEKCTSNIWKVLQNSPGSSFSIPSQEGCCVASCQCMEDRETV